MPIRVYDIAVKLGLENKDVLVKAKSLGIAAARVASSSLDKITAEYLEQQLVQDKLSRQPQHYEAPLEAPNKQNGAPVAATGITIRATNPEIHILFQRVLAGEIPFTLEICRDDGSSPLRAHLVEFVGDVVLESPKPRPAPPPRAELDERTKDLFRAAYYSAKHVSKDEWVNLAEYGSALKRQDPTFQPQDFGERSLGSLIRRIDDFEMKADEKIPLVYYVRLKGLPVRVQPELATAPPQPQGPRRMATGRIHNLKLGFGFIAPDDGTENVFFHASEVSGCTIFRSAPW